jgi:hypothetical protein
VPFGIRVTLTLVSSMSESFTPRLDSTDLVLRLAKNCVWWMMPSEAGKTPLVDDDVALRIAGVFLLKS